MAAGFVQIPCDSCRVKYCITEPVTRRESLFAWVADTSLGCEDYEPDHFHGVEGVLNVDVSGGVTDRRGGWCDGDRSVYGSQAGR